MDNEKKTKPQKAKEQKPRPQKEEERKQVDGHSENTFDFGGLPPRDLKKNLGCG
jgi:hypothetical protein